MSKILVEIECDLEYIILTPKTIKQSLDASFGDSSHFLVEELHILSIKKEPLFSDDGVPLAIKTTYVASILKDIR